MCTLKHSARQIRVHTQRVADNTSMFYDLFTLGSLECAHTQANKPAGGPGMTRSRGASRGPAQIKQFNVRNNAYLNGECLCV